jgi:hypothetical protein
VKLRIRTDGGDLNTVVEDADTEQPLEGVTKIVIRMDAADGGIPTVEITIQGAEIDVTGPEISDGDQIRLVTAGPGKYSMPGMDPASK